MRNKNYLKNLESILQEYLGNRFKSEFSSFNPIMDRIGDLKTEKGKNELGDWVKTTYTSSDGSYVQISYLINGKPEKITNNKLSELDEQLKYCIEKEDFEGAVVLRDKIKSLEKNKSKIEELKLEMDEAIKEQDFERAIEIREELKKLN